MLKLFLIAMLLVSVRVNAVDERIKPLLDELHSALKAKQEIIDTELTAIVQQQSLPDDIYLDLHRKTMALLFRFRRVEAMKTLNEQVYKTHANAGKANYEVYYWLYQSNIAKREDKLSDMLAHAEKALAIALKKQVTTVYGAAYLTAGDANFINEHYAQSITYLKQAIENAPNQASAVAYRSRLGDIYRDIGEYAQAVALQSEAISGLEVLNEPARLADAYYSLANTYLSMENLQQAALYFEESKKRDLEQGNETNAAYSAIKLCETYTQLKQFSKALLACEFGKIVFSKKEVMSNIASAEMAFGALYSAQQHYEKAEQVIQQVLDNYQNTMRSSRVSNAYLELAKSQLAQDKLVQALANAQSALTLMASSKSRESLAKAYLVLSQIHEKKGDFQQANQALKQHNALREQTLITSHDKAVTRLQSDIEHVRKQQSIEQLEQIKAKQQSDLDWHTRNVKVGAVVIPIILLLIFWAFRLQIQKRRLLDQEKALLGDLMEKKNQLLADVSHELGTPITVLKLQVEALQDDLEEDVYLTYDSLAAKLNDIERLISDIYQLAQYDIGANVMHLDTVNLYEHLQQWGLGAEKLIEHFSLSFTFDNQLPKDILLNIDGDRVNQVLANLVNNGVKYTQVPGVVQVKSYLKGDEVLIEVEDSAPGVAKAEHDKIFERLYRVDSSRSRETGGSGLGLAICQSIILAHQGHIRAEDSSLGGLKVVISLPRSGEPIHG